ncbi:putative filamentation protein [Erysiphe neolycopersici]|uniref:Putative filamentation protein n=1 Tax=Erysiphe neolycopersici TaxID=212602 RepID=A0A420HXT5_9PEZI|nr:putative filamentation protein [Erysiphe neolycopersici]
MSREQTKATLFIQKLDDARSHGDWAVLPELIRKVKKHAPQRVCLALTAESEHALALELQQLTHGSHLPSTLTKTKSIPKLSGASKYISRIKDIIEKESTHAGDKFQAQVCLSTIHWLLGESTFALVCLPKNIKEEFSKIENSDNESPKSTRLCAIKASYIKGTLLQKESSATEALSVFQSTLPVLSNLAFSHSQETEVRMWVELFLTGVCTLSSSILKKNYSSDLTKTTLSAFRFWAKLWDTHTSNPVGGRLPLVDVCRRYVWKEYYVMLSNLLRKGLPIYPDNLSTSSKEVSSSLPQRSELCRVEAYYESLLMAETHFPKAEEVNIEVEDFVDLMMRNWRTVCGTRQKNKTLEEGEAVTISRGVLEILYRAAKKTFHSTAILRHLFTVHLAIAEFNLAFKAFDIYIVIVMKGKSRFEKTGHLIDRLDDDDTVLRVASEYIKALCRYGSYELAEKANKTSRFFEDWLETRHLINSNEKKANISPLTFALIWRCIGIGYAQWARATFDAASRSDIQAKAIECFNKSLLPQFQSSNNPETLFALGFLLAERRQIDAAIKAIKTGLLSNSSEDSQNELAEPPRQFAKQRLSISLWHLLALLLSARQEFLPALKSCEGALQLFNDSLNLSVEGTSRENEINSPPDQSIIDNMDYYERENLLQVKMTQLSLIELLEGSDVAINESYEILSLYTKLFGDPRIDQRSSDSTMATIPPKSSTGKSLRESILNCSIRKAHDSISDDQNTYLNAPIIHITSDNGKEEKRRSLIVSAASCDEASEGRSISHPRKIENMSYNTNTSGGRQRSQSQSAGNVRRKPDAVNQEQLVLLAKTINQSQTSSMSVEELAPTETTQTNSRITLAENASKKIIKSDEPSFAQENHSSGPTIIIPKKEQKRYKMTILVEVWLLIGEFYRRASMYDDAQGAIDEANQLVNLIESEIFKDSNASLSSSKFIWEGGKTVADLRSNIYSELGYLAIAEGSLHSAITNFETALLHLRDHPNAIVGLSNILMDIYTKKLTLPPSIPSLNFSNTMTPVSSSSNTLKPNSTPTILKNPGTNSLTTSAALGDLLNPVATVRLDKSNSKNNLSGDTSECISISAHEINYKDPSPAFLNRLAARDRAFGLLNSLTKTGQGWNHSEAWFALARAYEQSDQFDKAKEVLWWCVELEDGRGVRDLAVVNCTGYVL